VVVNAPPSFEPDQGARRRDGEAQAGRRRGIAFFLAFVTTKKEVDALARWSPARRCPMPWSGWPIRRARRRKYTSEISRDAGNEALGEAGFEPVRMVAIDEDWTGKRFRRVAFIKNLTRDPRALVSKEGKEASRDVTKGAPWPRLMSHFSAASTSAPPSAWRWRICAT
jgi:hypothetical protein